MLRPRLSSTAISFDWFSMFVVAVVKSEKKLMSNTTKSRIKNMLDSSFYIFLIVFAS